MSVSTPVPLHVTVHGANSGANANFLSRLLVLGDGTRNNATPTLAVPDGTAPLSASICYRTMDRYFPGMAAVSATVTFRFNIADVVSLKVKRVQETDRWFSKTMIHPLFPRTAESENPYAFMWPSLTTFAFFRAVSSLAYKVQEWLYVRYGGIPPVDVGPKLHVFRRFSRPLTGTAEFDIVSDETMYVTATLITGELFVASVRPTLPHSSHVQSRTPSANRRPGLSKPLPLSSSLSRFPLTHGIDLLKQVSELRVTRWKLPGVKLPKRIPVLETAGAHLQKQAPELLSVPNLVRPKTHQESRLSQK